MNGAHHHREAERLLSEARTEQDSIRRSQILAEAQVHATLALGALAEMTPASRGHDEAADTKSTRAAHSGMPEGGGLVPAGPAGQPHPPSAPGGFPRRASRETTPGRFTMREQEMKPPLRNPETPLRYPAPAGPPGPVTPRSVPVPARPATQPSVPDDPDPDEQNPGDPDEQEPGGFTPF